MAVTQWGMQMTCYLQQRKIPEHQEFLQEAMNTVQQWCDRTQLSFNPQKMVIVPFLRKRDFRGLKEPSLSGHTLQLTTEGKNLGLILDKGLTWKAQLKNVINKAQQAFWTCKGTSGKTWGLKNQGGALNLHHGGQTCNDLQLHGLVAEVQTQYQQDGAQ